SFWLEGENVKAVKWFGAGDVRVGLADEPKLRSDSDALVRPTSACICGTDLHVYKGELTSVPGSILGHEFMGIVEEVGPAVKGFRPGDRVISSCWVADGACWYCRHGYYTQCMNINIYGMGPVYGESLDGAFAELVRVPYADTVLIPAPENVPDEKLVTVGDSLATGFEAVVNAGMKPGDFVVVIGCGPVGLYCGMFAQLLGASTVVAADVVHERLAAAEKLGFVAVDAAETDVADEVREMTDGVGADFVVEAVGRTVEPLLKAIETVRRKGTVSVVGYHLHEYTIPSGMLWLTEKRLVFSIGDPIRNGETLTKYVKHNRIDPSKIITHRITLEEVPQGFEMFAKKQALKVFVKI
ncbi:MAG: alcohol dehydrogenase catalytic domain-containing protein, partial [Candidatus Caldarchaeum sp.]|nr:alcohol dehydrogenase catalytic domain-containing protein [Candidatus Caldarchaeum sp.]